MALRRSSIRTGLTLIDLLITTLIIGILAAVAAPKLGSTLDNQRATAAAGRVAADLAYARRYARTNSSDESVSFDGSNHRYSLSTAKHLDRPSLGYSIDLSKYPYRSEIVTADFEGTATVTFNSYGIPSSAGQVTVQSGSVQKTIDLAADTGKATIQP